MVKNKNFMKQKKNSENNNMHKSQNESKNKSKKKLTSNNSIKKINQKTNTNTNPNNQIKPTENKQIKLNINKQLKKKNAVIELNSKLKKKILNTKKFLNLKEDVIDSAINYIKKENSEISEKLNQKFYGNFYAYIVLKNKITDEIDSFKKQEFEKKIKKFSKFEIEKAEDPKDLLDNNHKKLKNFYYKLPLDVIDEENNLKILIVNKPCINNNKNNNHKKNYSFGKNEDSKIELYEKLLKTKIEKINLEENNNNNNKNNNHREEKALLIEKNFQEIFDKKIEIYSEEEFIDIIKRSKNKTNLNFLYKQIICDNKLKQRINDIFKKFIKNDSDSNNDKDNNKDNLKMFNNFDRYIDVDFFDNDITSLNLALNLSLKRNLVKNLNDKIFKIKFSNCSSKNEDIKANLKNLCYNLSSILLEKSNKYNNVKSILIKSENSIPFTIQGELGIDEIDYFEIN